MPYCANCRWSYTGEPRFCRECGRPIYRRPARSTVQATGLRLIVPEIPGEARRSHLTMPDRGALMRLGSLAGFAFVAAGVLSSAASWTDFPLDEAWVRLVYARNLAEHARIEFNPGQAEAGIGSVLWISLMALLIKTLGALGLSVVALAKLAGIFANGVVAMLTGELASRATSSRVAALAAGGLVALNPVLGFAAASGMETTWFIALSLGALVAFHGGRVWLAGSLLALAFLTRLEGLALVVLVFVAALAGRGFEVADRRASHSSKRRRLLDLAALAGPSLAAAAVWLSIAAPSDRMLPQPVYAAAAERGSGPPFPDLAALWYGYLEPWNAYVGGGAWLLLLPILVLGAIALVQVDDWKALPLVGFPLALAVVLPSVLRLQATPGLESTRRLFDPMLPPLAIMFVLGVRALWMLGRHASEQRSATQLGRAWSVGAVAAPLVASSMVIAGQAAAWNTLPMEYAQAARRLDETYFEAALALRETTDETSLVASIEPGTLRYVSRRPVADLTGLHTPTLAGRPPIQALADARAEFAVLPRGSPLESYPPTMLLTEFVPPPGAGGHTAAVGLFRVSPGAQLSHRDGLYAFPTEGLRRIDYLDVANDQAELAHAYQVTNPRDTVSRALKITSQHAVADIGQAFIGSETFVLQAEAGRDLILARRFEEAGTGFRISIDGQALGEWWPRAGTYALSEDTVRIPGILVRGARVTLRLELIPGSTAPAVSFGYWSLVE